MPVVRQHHITRRDLQTNRHVLYLFGDNCERRGRGGQAVAMRGERNAVGVRTKYAPDNRPSSFFRNDPHDVYAQCRMIDADLERVERHLQGGGVVVIPADGLGTGLARLRDHSEATFAYLENRLEELARAVVNGGC